MSKDKVDPQNYLKLSEPFPNREEAQKAIDAFWEELYALRNKYKIPDCYVVLGINFVFEDGESGQALLHMHCGNELMREPMAAWAFGREQAERQERIFKLVEASPKLKHGRSRP